MAAAKESRKLSIDSLTTAIAKQKAKQNSLLKRQASERSRAGQSFLNKSKIRTPGDWRYTLEAVGGKLLRLERKLQALKDDVAAGRPARICFGSRKLFLSQQHLADNGFGSHRLSCQILTSRLASRYWLPGV